MNVVGIDIGFGFTKATNGKDTLVFKSIFGEAADIQFREQLLGGSSPEEHLHIELDGESFFVGELAERQSDVRSFTLDQNQFITNFAKTMAMAALSRLVSANDSFNLVTGLPVSFYRRHREELSGLLLGAHSLVVLDASGERPQVDGLAADLDRPARHGVVHPVELHVDARLLKQLRGNHCEGTRDAGFRGAAATTGILGLVRDRVIAGAKADVDDADFLLHVAFVVQLPRIPHHEVEQGAEGLRDDPHLVDGHRHLVSRTTCIYHDQ